MTIPSWFDYCRISFKRWYNYVHETFNISKFNWKNHIGNLRWSLTQERTCKYKNRLEFISKQKPLNKMINWRRWWYECVARRCNRSFDWIGCPSLNIQIGSCGFFMPSASNKPKTFWIGLIFNIRPFSEPNNSIQNKLFFRTVCGASKIDRRLNPWKVNGFFKAKISFALHIIYIRNLEPARFICWNDHREWLIALALMVVFGILHKFGVFSQMFNGHICCSTATSSTMSWITPWWKLGHSFCVATLWKLLQHIKCYILFLIKQQQQQQWSKKNI